MILISDAQDKIHRVLTFDMIDLKPMVGTRIIKGRWAAVEKQIKSQFNVTGKLTEIYVNSSKELDFCNRNYRYATIPIYTNEVDFIFTI